MKYLIVGLGNIGPEYQDTRHNIGFNVLDAFAKASNAVFEDMRYGAVCEMKLKGRTLVLLKPNTYMNLSGKAVSYWMQKEKIALEDLLVSRENLPEPDCRTAADHPRRFCKLHQLPAGSGRPAEQRRCRRAEGKRRGIHRFGQG